MKKLTILLTALSFYINSYSQCNDSLEVIIDIPFPIASAAESDTAFCADALDSILSRIPHATIVKIPFNMDLTDTTDWLAVLDVCEQKGVKAIVGFADPQIQDVFRPDTLSGGIWDLKDLGEFASNSNCVNHPALYALNITDEPWEWQIRGYFNWELREIYDTLKVMGGNNLDLFMNFSREIWKLHGLNDGLGGQGPNMNVFWSDSICDIVQISTLEFQDNEFDRATLDSTHFYSRKIINAYTPNIKLITSIQVFGQSIGPGNGSWFPVGDSLVEMMDMVTDSKYQDEHALSGFIFQKWDASDINDRPNQVTLGDATFPGSDPNEIAASNEIIQTINNWFAPCVVGLENFVEMEENKLKLYPNPASDLINVYIDNENSKFKYLVISIDGKVLMKGEQTNVSSFSLDIRKLKKGSYFFVAKLENGNILTKRFVKT